QGRSSSGQRRIRGKATLPGRTRGRGIGPPGCKARQGSYGGTPAPVPSVRALHSLLASGELGKLHYITSNRLNLGQIRREENALWSFAPHDISVILSLASGQMPDQVRCSGGEYLS